MSERSQQSRTEPISVEQLTEAITSGVLRALASAQAATANSPLDFVDLAGKRGIFGKVTVTGGMWPDRTEFSSQEFDAGLGTGE